MAVTASSSVVYSSAMRMALPATTSTCSFVSFTYWPSTAGHSASELKKAYFFWFSRSLTPLHQ